MADTPLATPFDTPSDLPLGLPPFDRIATGHFAPAFAAGVAEHRAELDALCARDLPAAEFLDGLESAGQRLARAEAVFWNLVGTDVDDALRAVQEEWAAPLAAHHDAVRLDPRVLERVRRWHAEVPADLDAEGRRLLERLHDDAVRSGALLDAAGAERLRGLNAELAELTTRYETALLADTNDLALHLDDAAELAGASPAEVERARAAAAGNGLDGFLLPLGLPSVQPLLEVLERRDVRERLHRASLSRGGRGGPHDTRALLVAIARLRAQRAELLGFADHASWVVADETAGSAGAATAVLRRLAPAARRNAEAERAELTALLRADGHDGPLRGWDWPFYAARLRAQRFSLDAAALRPHFALERVLRDGVFATATALYGLTFAERHDLPVYAPGVRVFEVAREGEAAFGLYLFDPFARPSKRGGAWMSSFAEQSRLLGSAPVVVNCLNLAPPAAGEDVHLSVDEVETLFHEFGHTLHGLLSDVHHPRFSGTNVPRDFVEFPSQVNEFWGFEPEVLHRYARHDTTGEPLADDVAAAVRAAREFGQGFATLEYLAAALLDQAWHSLGSAEAAALGADDVEGFEARALAAAGVDLDAVAPRYRTAYFQHVFGGGYAAAYYSYVWSEVLDADTVDWFAEHGGLRRENGEAFRRAVLSRGGSVDPLAAYREFRGRDAVVEPLLRRRGLVGA